MHPSKVTIEELPKLERKEFTQVSASQIKTYRDCPSKWFFGKIFGLRTPPTSSMEFGTKIHKQMEDYVDGEMKPEDMDAEALELIQYIPEIDDKGIHRTELKINYTPEGWPVSVNGFIDLTSFHHAKEKLWVIDYKTTSNIRYAPLAEDLVEDPQKIIYTEAVFKSFPKIDTIIFEMPYVQKSKHKDQPPLSKKVSCVVHRKDREPVRKLENTVHEMTLDAQKDIEEIDVNQASCGKYGGCPYAHLCRVQKEDKLMGVFDEYTNKQDGINKAVEEATKEEEPVAPKAVTASSGGGVFGQFQNPPKKEEPKPEPTKQEEPESNPVKETETQADDSQKPEELSNTFLPVIRPDSSGLVNREEVGGKRTRCEGVRDRLIVLCCDANGFHRDWLSPVQAEYVEEMQKCFPIQQYENDAAVYDYYHRIKSSSKKSLGEFAAKHRGKVFKPQGANPAPSKPEAQEGSSETPAPKEEPSAPAKKSKPKPKPENFTLYVGALKLGADYQTLEDYLALAEARICAEKKVPYFNSLDYAEGKRLLAAVVKDTLKRALPDKDIVVTSFNSAYEEALAVLKQYADAVVMGIK